MRKLVKNVVVLMLCVSMLALTACGISVGNPPGGDDSFKELFPDTAAEFGNAYKATQVGYKFSLNGYGEMLVHVDTSNGHKFVLDEGTTGGFTIQDENGNIVLHVYSVLQEVYEQATADLTEVRTVNGRDYFYHNDPTVDPVHLMSYMADCGLDVGFVMEAYGDEDAFKLVAFRGTPLPGSSSDLYAYKGNSSTVTDDYIEEPPVEEPPVEVDPADDIVVPDDSTTTSDITTSTLSSDVQNSLASLDTDYGKILWGVQYSVSEQYPGLVISVTPFKMYDTNRLLVALTNLHNQDIKFTGTAKAADATDAIIGETFVYADCIGAGNTVFATIDCGTGTPDGRIKWEECEISTSEYKEYVPWEADYSASGSAADGMLTVDYSIYGANDRAIVPGTVYIVLLDESGFVVAEKEDYLSDEVAGGDKATSQLTFYEDKEVLARVKDIAIFAESAVSNY